LMSLRVWRFLTKAVSDPKLFSCLFEQSVLCSHRKSSSITVMGRCFECDTYKACMLRMEEEDEEIDAEALAESERINRFAHCHFESCFCDGAHGKYACFGYEESDGQVKVWKCPRFHVEQLGADSVMRQAYRDLVKGLSP
jgi:hypothetical protein